MNELTDIFSLIDDDTTQDCCTCSTSSCNSRNDVINLSNTPMILNIYRGQSFTLELDNIPDNASKLTLKCDAFTKDFTYDCDNKLWTVNLSDDETITLIPDTYSYYIYINDQYLYTGKLNVRDSEYYTNGIGLLKYKFELLNSKYDEIKNKLNEYDDKINDFDKKLNSYNDKLNEFETVINNNSTQIINLAERVQVIEDNHCTVQEISALCDEVYNL